MSVGANPTTHRLLTAEEFMLRPEPVDGTREELLDGRIVDMPPPKGLHGVVTIAIGSILHNFVRSNKLGWVVTESGVILHRDPDVVFGPDVAFYSIKRVPQLPTGYFEVAPDLAVKVISPSDRHSQVQAKIWDYLKYGTRMIWVVDPEPKTITVYHSMDRVQHLEASDTLQGGEVLPGFSCPVASFLETGAV